MLDYLMFAPSYLPHIGGVERHVWEVHRALARRGLQGHIVVFKDRKEGTATEADVTWLPSQRWRGLPSTARATHAVALARLLVERPAQVLHFHDPSTFAPYHRLLRMLGHAKRTFLTFHGWDGRFPPLPREAEKLQKLEKASCGDIAIGEYLTKWYGLRPDMISYGAVDVQRYAAIEPACEALPFSVAYVGRLEPDTGVLQLVSGARAHAEKLGQPLTLHLYGSGSLRDALAREPRDSKLELHLHDPIERTDQVLRSVPVVFASGFLSVLEALCAKRIVISYYDHALREDYLKLHPCAAAVHPCGSATEVAAVLDTCRASMGTVVERSAAAWTWAREQSWDALAGRYVELWRTAPRLRPTGTSPGAR